MWGTTTSAVRSLMAWPPDKTSLYRDVSFVLNSGAAEAITFGT
jgi:hypothetical protein